MENFKMHEPVNMDKLIKETKTISQTTNNPSVKRDMDMFNIDMTIEDIKNSNENENIKNKKILKLKKEYLNLSIKNINSNPNYNIIESVYIVENTLNEIQNLGGDTSKYEKLIPDLRKKVLTNSINKQINEINEDPTYDIIESIYVLEEDILKLKKLGVDTSKYEKLIPDLRKKIESNNPDNYLQNALDL